MLNPDGVYTGNYRTGLMGIDFNRLFYSGKASLFPEIEALRNLVKQCKSSGKLDLYLDLHGHSINPVCFIYGPNPSLAPDSDFKGLESKLNNSSFFSKKHCMHSADS